MNWFIFALCSGLLFALSRSVARLFLRTKGNALAFTSIHDFIAGLVLLPFVIMNFKMTMQFNAWLLFLGVVVFAFLADWLAFKALKKIDSSIYQIVLQSRHIFVLFGGLLFFTEAITMKKIIAVLLIILGTIIALYYKQKITWTIGITFALLSTFFAVVAFVFAKFAVVDFSEITLASFELMAIGLLSFGLLKFNAKAIANEFKMNKLGLIFAGSLFGFFELFLFLALKVGDISNVIPVTQSSLVFGVLIGIIFLKERENILQKIIGMAVIVAGILVLYNF